MPRAKLCFVLCGLSSVIGLACYRSGSVSPSSPPPATTPASTAQADNDAVLATEPLNASDVTSVRRDDRAAPEAVDAEDVLKQALSRATDEKKRLLVHLGAPG